MCFPLFRNRIAVKTSEQQQERDELRILPTDDKKTVNMKKKKLYKLEKEKEAKAETEYYKSKQNAWQQFQNRSQQKRKRLIAEGVIADRRDSYRDSCVAFKKDSIFRTADGTTRTSGEAPIERVMTPAPKRANTFRNSLLCSSKRLFTTVDSQMRAVLKQTLRTIKVFTNTGCLVAVTVEGSALSLQSVHHIHSSHRLSLRVLRVRHGVTNHSVQERLQHRTGFVVDQTRNTLHTTSSRQTADSGLRDTQNVVTHHLAMSLRTSLAKTFTTLATTRHD